MSDAQTPRERESADVPALHPSGVRDRMTAPLPMPFSVRGLFWRLVRGRRQPWQDVIRGSGLPPEIMQTIAVIVRSTRLWSSEKSDVARELCAHFADGIEAGASADDLRRSFGEPKGAAKLIRVSKRRGRPLWWHAWKYAVRGMACVVLLALAVYGVLALMFYASSPKITRNYSAELNATILATPQAERAWPRYLVALRELGSPPMTLMNSLTPPGETPDPKKREDVWPQRPGDERWPLAAAWVNSKSGAVEKIRQAAAMEHLGCQVTNQIPEDYLALVSARAGSPAQEAVQPDNNPILVGLALPYLGEFRQMARVLAVDARIATQEHDADRFVADIRAICGLAHQCDELPILINKLVGVAILAVAIDVAEQPLATELLDDAHLRDLAHTFASFDDRVLNAPLTLEKQFLADMVQRTYSDNGRGDGHMTREGYTLMNSMAGFADGGRGGTLTPLDTALGPLSVAGTASRKDLLEEADKLYALAEQDIATPLWKAEQSGAQTEVERLKSSGVLGARYSVLTALAPGVGAVHSSIEHARQRRDGVLVALALESYRRSHGAYPGALDALVPAYLPAIPPDRYDGRPIKYRLIGDGSAARPVVYSIGVDRVDDGGRGPKDARDAANMFRYRSPADVEATLANPRTHDAISGDWVLYKPE